MTWANLAALISEHAVHTSVAFQAHKVGHAIALSRGLVAARANSACRVTTTRFAATLPKHAVLAGRALHAVEAGLARALSRGCK